MCCVGRCVRATGGVFDERAYNLHSYVTDDDEGLQVVGYFVADDQMGLAFPDAWTKDGALENARIEIARFSTSELEKASLDELEARRNELKAIVRLDDAGRPRLNLVPKRRLRIFEKSGGKCHYCQVQLDLSGKWEIDHKMPRALKGGNEDHNLVASCVSCNRKKKDRTDLEFQAALNESEGS